ncbi:MAG: hypothetical protein GXO42_01120 [bacterium]|nr:hypothetical protein [bacterium]
MKYLISTSKRPSNYSRSFAKDLEKVLPGYYLTRGKASLDYIFDFAAVHNFDIIVLIGEKYGNPATLEFYEPDGSPRGLQLAVKGVKLMRDMRTKLGADLYSFTSVLSVSPGFKPLTYAKILEKITGLPLELGSKKQLLEKYGTVLNLERSKDPACIFRLCFYTLVGGEVKAVGPVIKVMGFL